MKLVKKAAIISVVVLMISLVPAFALNETNTTNGTQDLNQTKITNQTQSTTKTTDQNCNKNCNTQNCGNCDGEQQKYQYGQKNSNAGSNCGTCNGEQHKYQYGLKNGNTGANNCGKHLNCPKS